MDSNPAIFITTFRWLHYYDSAVLKQVTANRKKVSHFYNRKKNFGHHAAGAASTVLFNGIKRTV
jgi:hypothetical protein